MKVKMKIEKNLFLRSGAIESSNSSIEQGDIDRLGQISEFISGHGERRMINPRIREEKEYELWKREKGGREETKRREEKEGEKVFGVLYMRCIYIYCSTQLQFEAEFEFRFSFFYYLIHFFYDFQTLT